MKIGYFFYKVGNIRLHFSITYKLVKHHYSILIAFVLSYLSFKKFIIGKFQLN
jgi:hypothetical protein